MEFTGIFIPVKYLDADDLKRNEEKTCSTK